MLRILVVVSLLVLVQANGQILFKNGVIDTNNELSYVPTNKRDAEDIQQFIVQFNGVHSGKKILADFNLKSSYYVPHNTYVVTCSGDVAARLGSTEGVKWVGHYDTKYKLSSNMNKELHVHPVPKSLKRSEHSMTKQFNVLLSKSYPVSSTDLEATLHSMCVQCDVVVSHNARSAVLVFPADMNDKDIVNVAHQFAAHESVEFIESRPKFKVNNYFTHPIVQSGQIINQTDPVSMPFYARNIRGKDQVIGVGDTGLDVNNCFFYDHDHSVQYYTDLDAEIIPSAHKKIAGYVAFGNDDDYYSGHGTHVCGSIAGSADPANPWHQFHGAAPEARIAFFDAMDEDGGLVFPEQMEDYFELPYEMGARIHSNSWGANDNNYDITTAEIDEYLFEHQDILVLFAAGNDGANGMNTVGSPAVGKNVLTIGASKTSWGGFDFNERHKYVLEAYLDTRDTLCDNQDYFQGSRVVCSMLNATVPCPQALETFCHEFINESVCCKYELLKPMCCPDRDEAIDNEAYHFNENNLAEFSSLGPAADGRIKPDVVAPGDVIWSAKAHAKPDVHNLCAAETKSNDSAILAMSGTSMATPTAAGHASLLREYLSKGYIGRGTEDRTYSIKHIPASLLKALIINSATPLTGGFKEYAYEGGPFRYLNLNDLDIPNEYEGHGRMLLSDAVPFMNGQPQFNVLIARDSLFPTTAVEHTVINTTIVDRQNSIAMCFKIVNASYTLDITMAYNDYAGNPAVALQLIADIDMVIVRNGYRMPATTPHFQTEDRINNVETARIIPSIGDNYEILVQAMSIPLDPVSYSLVASGGIEAVECPKQSPLVCIHGQSVNGVCVCYNGYYGVDCRGSQCPNDCSNLGVCNHDTGKCKCLLGYGGDDCTKEIPCPNNCSGHGECHDSHCECATGYFDLDCSEAICTGNNVYSYPNGTIISFSEHDAADRMSCTMTLAPMADYGHAFTELMLNFTLFDFSDGTEVKILAIDTVNGSTYNLGTFSGDHEPFHIKAPTAVVIIQALGFAPTLGNKGFKFNYYGMTKVPVDPSIDYIDPDFGVVNATYTMLTISGTWMVSPNDTESDVNVTIGLKTAEVHKLEVMGMIGTLDIVLEAGLPVGEHAVTVCSGQLNVCLDSDQVFTVIDKFQVERFSPSVLPKSGYAVLDVYMSLHTQCYVQYVSVGSCFSRNIVRHSGYYTVVIDDMSKCGPTGYTDIHIMTNYCGLYYNGSAVRIGDFGISGITPQFGHPDGGLKVNVTGTDMATDRYDIKSLTLAGVAVASIEHVSPTLITVVTGAAPGAMYGRARLDTVSHGVMYSTLSFHYFGVGDITSVEPPSCTREGGCNVCLHGENFYEPNEYELYVKMDNIDMVVTSSDAHGLCFTVPESNKTNVPLTIMVVSGAYGTTVEVGGFTYLDAGHILSLSASAGPRIGGTAVDILGTNLCHYDSITKTCDVIKVTVAGIEADVHFSNATLIKITARPHPSGGSGNIVVISKSQLTTTSTARFVYHADGVVKSLEPSHAPMRGNTLVVINAKVSFCENVNDIESVYLAGIPAKVHEADRNKVVVYTGKATSAGAGDVIIKSYSYGTTVLHKGFTYDNDHGLTSGQLWTIILAGTGGIAAVAGGLFMLSKKKQEKKVDLLLADAQDDEDPVPQADYSVMPTTTTTE